MECLIACALKQTINGAYNITLVEFSLVNVAFGGRAKLRLKTDFNGK